MSIKKQEFYEGAALYALARAGSITCIRYESPFFLLNDLLLIYLKYSTKGRSPWGFSFAPDEQAALQTRAVGRKLVIGLICGSDGIAALTYESYCQIAPAKTSAVHIACYRQHGEHYEISGPTAKLDKKVAPSNWSKILNPLRYS